MNLIVLGPPGAGKGTQAEVLAKELCVPKVSTGDILREAVQAGTALGRAAQETMNAGRLVSDDVVVGIVRERLERPDARGGFVLDGFPRTIPQAEALDAMMQGRGPLVIVDIVVPDDELVRRLVSRRVCGRCGANAGPGDATAELCARCGGHLVQRSDDTESVVRARLKTYAAETRPLVEFYRRRPTFRSVDGAQAPAAVARLMREAVTTVLAGQDA